MNRTDFTVWWGIEEINIKKHIIATGQLSFVRGQHELSYFFCSHAHDHHCRKRMRQIKLYMQSDSIQFNPVILYLYIIRMLLSKLSLGALQKPRAWPQAGWVKKEEKGWRKDWDHIRHHTCKTTDCTDEINVELSDSVELVSRSVHSYGGQECMYVPNYHFLFMHAVTLLFIQKVQASTFWFYMNNEILDRG